MKVCLSFIPTIFVILVNVCMKHSAFAVVSNTQFKRWVSGLKAYDNVEKLRQVMLIE